jgi:hypothetical protein
MKVELIPGIATISGTFGKTKDGHRMEFRTFQRPDGKKEVRLYSIPKRERVTPVSEAEIRARNRFSIVNIEVTKRIQNGDTRRRQDIFREVYAEMFK